MPQEPSQPYEVRLLMRKNLLQHLIQMFHIELKVLQEDEIDYREVLDDGLYDALEQEIANLKWFVRQLYAALDDVENTIRLLQVGKPTKGGGDENKNPPPRKGPGPPARP